MKQVLSILFISLFGFQLKAQPEFIEVESVSEWEEVLTLSQQSKRLLFVYVVSDDCDPCDLMFKETLGNDGIAEEITNHFIPVLIRNESTVGKKFILTFDVVQLPSSLWMTGTEFVWMTLEGEYDAEEFNTKLSDLRNLIRTYPNKLQYALSGGDTLQVEDWFDLMFLSSINRTSYESDLINQFKNGLSWDSLQSPKYWPFLATYVSDVRSPIFNYIAIDPTEALGADFPWSDYYDMMYEHNLDKAIREYDSSRVESIELLLLPTKIYDSTATKTDTVLTRIALWQEFLLRTGEFGAYLDYSDSALRSIPLTEDIVKEQIHVLTSYSLSDDAFTSGLRWVNHTLKTEKSANLYIMKADMLLRLGKLPQATEALIEAEKQNPNDKQKESIEFLDMIIRNRY